MRATDSLLLVAVLLLVQSLVFAQEEKKCNICGCDDCVIFAKVGSVEFIDEKGAPRKFPCKQLQNQIDVHNAISQNFCRTELPQYVVEPCKCHYSDGEPVTLQDVKGGPTASPSLAPVDSPDDNTSGSLLVDGSFFSVMGYLSVVHLIGLIL